MTDIRLHPNATLKGICSFLGVDPNFKFNQAKKMIHKNQTSQFGAFAAYKLPVIRKPILRID
jgi:hypothetical protein